MKVLLYSHVFAPSTGGVETVSMALAEGFRAHGIECTVLTRTPGADAAARSFRVVAAPDREAIRRWVRWADVVLFNGASLALQPWVLCCRKPFVWVHVGYQVCCIDGLGWVDGEPAPLTPWASFSFHRQRRGTAWAARELLKLGLRRFVAKHLVTRNVAITQWMARALALPRQVQIYNPFPIDRFAAAADRPPQPDDFDFVYLGRIVSEKGVDTLLEAFARVAEQMQPTPRLLLIGDGERMAAMQQFAQARGIAAQVSFAGRQTGDALVDWVSRGRIAVLPSAWNEPMGGVAVELMAAGRSLIVSARGGLAECAGDAGLSFPNGDAAALAERMLQLLRDPALQRTQAQRAIERAREFAPERFIAQYMTLLRSLVPEAL